ncbi:hypothetical protein E8E14_009766 [Neopestalotiopsis sp. 37M]|nr:hypothetical protein E8E14_009766 [Neopestalotiopsis sp. 37M]
MGASVRYDHASRVTSSWSFGDKEAVQIVCGKLLKLINAAVASEQQAGNVETTISHKSWIMEPYDLIVHNQRRIEMHSSTTDDEVAKKHFEILLKFLEDHQPGAWQKREEVRLGQCQQILFKHLWLLYPPGTTVFKKDDDSWRAYKVECTETVVDMKATILRIQAWFLDFNKTGTVLVPYRETFEISSFSRERPLEDMELIPDWFIRSVDPLNRKLIDRGWQYWNYRKTSFHREYRGDAWRQAPYNSRLVVIVDYSTSSRCAQPDSAMNIRDSTSRCSVCIGKSLGLLSFKDSLDEVPTDSHLCINDMVAPDFHYGDCWTDDEHALLFCPPKLWAFSLQFKTWNMIPHHHLKEIEKQDAPFEEELYMDSVRKDSLREIVSSYFQSGRSNSDNQPTTRKDRGLKILLIGNSGTGKTFTAECLSRKFGVALYIVTTGDLGVEPNMFDQKLHETFTRAANWNAMVLLDDVDLYACERVGYNHEQSALLPTFMRRLEYSDCLTFISMISWNDADPALRSRIHLAISFPMFSFASQQEIWLRFIKSLPQNPASKRLLTTFVDDELDGLDEGEHKNMNARQIKNCMDVALVLARNQGYGGVVSPHHIKTVLELGKNFKAHITQNLGRLAASNGRELFVL